MSMQLERVYFFFNDTATTEIYTLSLHDALPISATAYVIAIRVVVWLAGRMGVTLPPDLDPVLVVLLLGVTTDYTVFFLEDRKSTRLNSSHSQISYAVFCLKKNTGITTASAALML